MSTESAIRASLISPNVADSNMEDANVVDVVDKLARAVGRVAHAITAPAAGGPDQTGGHIESLTEAVMGVTAGLCRIADAIDGLAAAVANRD
jgi:hypothetical protein